MKLGVRVETGARIPRSPTGGYDPSHADADIVYDCTGSRPATRWASAPGSAVAVDQDGYVLVKPTLGIASQTQPTIFALGDCADTGPETGLCGQDVARAAGGAQHTGARGGTAAAQPEAVAQGPDADFYRTQRRGGAPPGRLGGHGLPAHLHEEQESASAAHNAGARRQVLSGGRRRRRGDGGGRWRPTQLAKGALAILIALY